ncbi:MAG: class I SAM-dependent methyltransferase [Flavipsychrobacter sp.]
MSSAYKEHWENVYATKQPHEVSWTQELPATSLDFIRSLHLPKSASIIDIGGGDSKLVDNLLAEGYTNLTVLDISEKAIERAKARLGERANEVTWIVSDIVDFRPTTTYDVWHDRAAFHFLTTPEQIDRYVALANDYAARYLIIGTFSDKGPKKCSGLDIKQYTEDEMQNSFAGKFTRLCCLTEDHTTPFNTTQNFLFCSFEKAKS